ncbi:bowman-birk serine protease inhibitor family protein (macronuclear) [Tetrahymena thermophila SB210]|uniref:Bowman-birk serine protease inhibitor family protein n=1 Tax=Tetrahymena thermophila (strain SB210) TaxID=312017 RepID=Q22UN0_TETTS|nr:bowman-birk serine protease inhibitor family protein [Tetrahymena thermophila SB210]EAR88940.2 bowman-birk serine protease inhibitor family protein [Tetrahymena thermophila SB210]|eukprot:XP_001009185.2 bowman-birk serine protease inhibitor family protein [Tetrahymena thermophila SB210]
MSQILAKLFLFLVFIKYISAEVNFKWLNYDQTLKQQKILNTHQIFYGNYLFDQSSDSSSTITQFALSGWFWPRIELNNYYTFFTLMQNSDELLSIQFNPSQKYLRQKTLGTYNQIRPSNSIVKDNWILIVTQLSFDGTQINVQTSLHQDLQYQIFKIGPNSYPYNKLVYKQNIILQIGNSFNIDGYYESLAYINNLFIYWNNNNLSDDYSYSNDLTAQQTQLIWNLDFFYTKANPNQYFNVANQMNIYTNGYLSTSPVLSVQINSVFKADYVNLQDSGGFTISFHFKVSSPLPPSAILLTIFNSSQQLQVTINSIQNSICLNGQPINGVSLASWNQVTLILKTQITYKAYLIVYGYESQILMLQLNKFLQGQAQFGDQSNTQSIQFSHIRYYKGTFLVSNQQNCFLQASNDNQCIICKSGYFINYQSTLGCENQNLPSINVNKDNIIDWNENFSNCPQNMVYDENTLQCVCMKQFYLRQDNTCQKCPNYCNQCTNEQTCKIQDINRNKNGFCPAGYFDDGYSCIIQKLNIYRQNNLVSQISSCNFNLNNSQMKLSQQGPYSFYFSFSVEFLIQNAYGKFAVLKDSNSEIFTFSYILQNGLPSIQLLIQGNPVYTATIRVEQPVWISLWTNLQQFFLLSNTFSKFFQVSKAINTNLKLTNPKICLGNCGPGYLCSQFTDKPFIFISNMTNPVNDPISLQTFLSEPVINLAKFEVHLYSDISKIFNNLLTQQASLKLQFQQPPQFDKLKGYKFNNQLYASISNINNNNYYWISFYCTIFPVVINQQVSLLSYALNSANNLLGQKVEYFLVPFGQKLLLRICYLTKCTDSKYSMLNVNESNSLFIFMRTQSPFSQSFNFIEFDVVCNYQREQIQFVNTIVSFTLSSINLNIGLQLLNTADYLFYLNLINIDKGDGLYYFDYNLEEPCFIFSDIQSMTCLYYKNRTVTYNNNQISEAECLNLTQQLGQTFLVNQQTRECLNINKLFQNCQIVDYINNTFQCLQCASLYSDLQNNCQCIDGYYMDSDTKTCHKCLPQCKTCSGKRDNCTQCHSSNQLTPSCQCADSSYFLNQQYQCQKCSEKCNSCVMNENYCTTCSQNRKNPPQCECDYQNYQEIQNTCVKLQCDPNCDQCIFDTSLSQIVCIKCKSGRTDPPFCSCMPSYKDNKDGTCSECPLQSYYDQKIGDCIRCSFPCLQCKNSKDNCTQCIDGLQMVENTCSCQNGLEIQYIQGNSGNQKYACRQSMQVKLSTKLQNSIYYLIFTFDYPLKSIDFENENIKNLIYISLSEIPQAFYSITNPIIKENQLILQLNVLQNINVINGQALFLETNKFLSDDNSYILSSYYQKHPIQFQIGPILFQENIFNINFSMILSEIKMESNQNIVNAIQSTQFIFYLLNTVQPMNLFLLLNLNFPPNLYMFYQIAGTFTYPDVVDYSSTDYKQSYSLFGYKFNQTEVHIINDQLYKRIGISNSFLVNAPIIILNFIKRNRQIIIILENFTTKNKC